MTGNGALSTIRVCNLGKIWALPHPMQIMADMGAEVINVESIQMGRGAVDPPKPARDYADYDPAGEAWNRYLYFNDGNVGMLSCTLDLTQPRGKELFRKLVLVSDFVCENFAHGVMERLGLGYQVMRSWRPDLIYLSLPGYGNTGPEADYVSYGTNQSGMIGLTHLTGYRGGDPQQVGINYGDPTAGIQAVSAVLAALLHRRKTGKGQFIDGSQREAGVRCLGEYLLDYQANCRLGERPGNRHSSMAPHGIYPSAGPDEWLAIAIATDDQWRRFCQAIGDPPWTRDERFADQDGRWQHQDDLDGHIAEWTRGLNHYQAMLTLQDAGVPAGAVLKNFELFDDYQHRGRDFYQWTDHPSVGRRRHPMIGWKMSQTPGRVYRAAPCLGEHNEYVLGELLGLSSEDLTQLEAGKVIGKVPLPESDPLLMASPNRHRKGNGQPPVQAQEPLPAEER